MCLNRGDSKTSQYFKQQGLGLPSALFLIVVMVMVVGAINQLNEMNAGAYGREWLSMRAFYAAQSGAQISAVHSLNSAQVMPTCDSGFINNFNFPGSILANCILNVECSVQTVALQDYVTLTSRATCGSGVDAATRIVQIRLVP